LLAEIGRYQERPRGQLVFTRSIGQASLNETGTELEVEMQLPVLGIDIAKQSYQVSLRVGKKIERYEFANQPEHFRELSAWLKQHKVKRCHACLEATNRYWEELAKYLYAQGHVVSVVNPSRIRDYARSKLLRNKTDKLDADLIADFCVTQTPDAWQPLRPEIQELQALMRHWEDLKALHSEVHARLSNGSPSPSVHQMLKEHLIFLDQQIAELKKQIENHIDQHPGLKQQRDLLVSIPGIGDLTAAKLLGENIQAFASTRALAAYAGLNPQHRLSGTSIHYRPRLSKIGNPHLRKALYFPAINAKRFNPIIRAFCERLSQADKHTMTIIGAAMRKLLSLCLGVLKSGIPFDPNYQSSALLS
jgi:transposase